MISNHRLICALLNLLPKPTGMKPGASKNSSSVFLRCHCFNGEVILHSGARPESADLVPSQTSRESGSGILWHLHFGHQLIGNATATGAFNATFRPVRRLMMEDFPTWGRKIIPVNWDNEMCHCVTTVAACAGLVTLGKPILRNVNDVKGTSLPV